MITGFVRFGDLSSARKLFDEMTNRDVVSWTAMIDGYAKAGDMASAMQVIMCCLSSAMLVELEPRNVGNYVLLSDIYAVASRWLDVSLVRNKMTEIGVRKIPGCSCKRFIWCLVVSDHRKFRASPVEPNVHSFFIIRYAICLDHFAPVSVSKFGRKRE